MPDGLRFKKNLAHPDYKTVHTFCITKEDGTRLYGTVLTYHEEITNLKILNSFEAFQSKYLDKINVQLYSNQKYDYSRTVDKLYVPKCLCFVTLEPIFQPLKVYLEQLYAVTVGQVHTELPLECYLYNILYEVLTPTPGKSLKLTGKTTLKFNTLHWSLG